MSEPFIAEIRIFAGNFAPQGWAFCEGQLLPISQNTALFSIVGTTYGGDGETVFGLPNLRSRAPMHSGQGPGLSPRTLGQAGGTETVTLSELQMPIHSHGIQVSNGSASTGTPSQTTVLAKTSADIYGPPADLEALPDGTALGGGQSHNNRQPFLVINFIIALVGLFPSE